VYRNDIPTAGLLPHGVLPNSAQDRLRVWQDTTLDLMVRGVGKSFTAGQPVLEGIEFSIPSGQSVALIGSNGAGKSTLLRCCMHLIEPDQGTVYLFGKPLQAQSEADLRTLRSKVGFVFQKHNLVPRLSALTNVLHGALTRAGPGCAWFQGVAPRTLREEAMSCLERVGLADKALQRADHLSGGQSQRVAVARALMQRPRFLVADEPAASLDPVSGDEVMGLFASLVQSEGITLLFTSHDLGHALRYADRVIALNHGRVVKDTLSAQTNAPELRALYDHRNAHA
jgi:phosphonate transport system ATP-binding protein